MIGSVDDFIRLRTSEDPADYHRAAHESAPLDVWLALVRDHPEMRFWVAQNKTVPLDVLELLATDDDPHVRSMVASKRKLSAVLQHLLATDTDAGVRDRLVHNARVLPEVLAVLASGDDSVAEKAQAVLKASVESAGGDTLD